MRRIPPRAPTICACLLTLVLGPLAGIARADRGFDYLLTGDPADVTPGTEGGLALMGGSPLPAALEWMIERSGGGDVVVIRTRGDDALSPLIDGIGAVDSVGTIVIHRRRAAGRRFVAGTLRRAEAILLAGGTRWDDFRLLKNTRLEHIIQRSSRAGVPVAGSGNGAAVLGRFVFTARRGGVTSRAALMDPYGRSVTLGRAFLGLPNMAGTLVDTHLSEKNRSGRLIAFLARVVKDGWAQEARGIGIDADAALLVDPDGSASVRGRGGVFFVRTPGPPQVCEPGAPLTFRELPVYRITRSGSFDLATWSGTDGDPSSVTVRRGTTTAVA